MDNRAIELDDKIKVSIPDDKIRIFDDLEVPMDTGYSSVLPDWLEVITEAESDRINKEYVKAFSSREIA